MVNALELFESFKNNQAKRALMEEELRLSPLKEETARFALARGNEELAQSRQKMGMLERQQSATERFQQGRLGIMAQQAQARASQGPKAPAGYRLTADGNMEAIPGGPADLKAAAEAQRKATGAEDVGIALGTLRDAYNRLEKGGGITSTTNAAQDNVIPALSASGPGQMVGKLFGTQNQSARNDISMSRPALLASLMKATGMSAKQMDSNAELKLWLQTATDPTLDIQSNRRALDNIERKYITGAGAAPTVPTAPAGPRPRATNPKTGAQLEFDGTQWVPVGK